MPGLLRGMAKTAAVVGTATATRNAVNRRMADKNVAAYTSAVDQAYAQQAPPPQRQAPAPYAFAPAPPQDFNPPAPEVFAQPVLQPYSPPPPGYALPAGSLDEEIVARLERLGALRAQGLLTEQEFAAAKGKLLAH
jgi:hypothetical protein